MKRLLLAGLALTVTGLAMAQSSFTIVRPADQSRVRENVRITFPMNSIPDNGYVGIYLGGKFLEAFVPAKGARFLYYDLDTKARGIPDGPLTIEAVLFQDFADRPRIVNRSSVQVNVANSASINVPNSGFLLRYRFRPGQQWVYQLENRIAINTMSEPMAQNTSRASLLAGSEAERIRLLYSVDNAFGNGDGLVRMQALPAKGKDNAVFTVETNPQPTRYFDYQMAPIYMRMTGTGREVFGSIPRYFPLDGTSGEISRTDLYALFPLPALPTSRQRPGDVWQSRFNLGDLDLDQAAEITSVLSKQPLVARAEFMGVEWEMGHPCARIRKTLEVRDPNAARTLRDAAQAQSGIIGASKIEEDIFFALDLGTVVKMDRTYTVDIRQVVQRPTGAGAAGAPFGGAPGGNFGGPSVGGATGLGGGGGRRGERANQILPGEADLNLRQQTPPFRGGPPSVGPGGLQGGPPAGGPGFSGRTGLGGRPGFGGGAPVGGGTANQTRITRVTVNLKFTLEK